MKEILEGHVKAIRGFSNTLLYEGHCSNPVVAKQLFLDILNEAEDAVLFINEEEGDDGDKT